MSDFENNQVLHVSTFRGCYLCFGDIITDASTHSWTSAFTRSLDTAFTNGTNRYYPGFTTNATVASIATLPSRSTSFATEGCKFNFSQCYERKFATFRTQDLAKDKAEKHISTDSDC
jgi:hypothetical protein